MEPSLEQIILNATEHRRVPCHFCKGTGIFQYEHLNTITVYGMDLKKIKDMWDFARSKGWKGDL